MNVCLNWKLTSTYELFGVSIFTYIYVIENIKLTLSTMTTKNDNFLRNMYIQMKESCFSQYLGCVKQGT
jgi:hypothetical protein